MLSAVKDRWKAMKKTILAIGAHPDDVELGTGCTIYQHCKEGDQVHVLIMSRGEMGVPDDQLPENQKMLDEVAKVEIKGKMREAETRRALAILGVATENMEVLVYPDIGIQCKNDLIQRIYSEIVKLKPDIVYTHYYEEQHMDHVNTCLATLHATRRTKTIMLYESPSTRPSFSPTYFVDISNCVGKKIEALKEHKSQAGKEYMDEEVIKARARFRGFQARTGKYAEAFVIYRMVG